MARKTLHAPLTLPDDPHGPATFIHTVEQRLIKCPGISEARVIPKTPPGSDHQATIELDYDPDLLSLAQINRFIQQAGGSLSESIGHLVLPIEGMISPQSEHVVQSMLNKLPGVTASASYVSQTLRVEFDRRQCALPEIVRRLDRLGMRLGPDRTGTVAGRPSAGARWRKPAWLELILSQPDLVLAIIGGWFLLAGLTAQLSGGPGWLRLSFLTASYVCCGWYLLPDVVKALRYLHLDIDFLMLAAAFGAASLGHYEEGALLLLLFSLGNAGQRLAMNRARGAIQALAKLAPQTAIIVDKDQTHREVRVEELRVGDVVSIGPGVRVPADGVIQDGNSAVDQSPITGESIPVEKTVGDDVFAGTINGQGLLLAQVSRPADQNTLAKVIKLVEEAQSTKSPTQLFTDRVEAWYVPTVLITTCVLIFLGPVMGIAPVRSDSDSLWAGWFYQAMAFLTAASPCALAIGTPAAVLSGIGRAAQVGVLIKGGSHLEHLGQVRVVAFDKTGTLTPGRPVVTDVVPFDQGTDPPGLLALAAAVERGSDHPLALALVAEAEAREYPRLEAAAIQQTPGMGIGGRVGDRLITIGRPAMLPAQDASDAQSTPDDAITRQIHRLESEGKTVMVVADGGRVIGAIAVADQPRPEAQTMIRHIKQLGIRQTILLTGDNTRTAQAVADAVGIDQCYAELLPQDKLDKVRQLDQTYGRVAMVGDGVNDAPAMANATVGIAVGGASGGGNDVAMETADVALLAKDLNRLPEAIAISRFTRRVIVQNLVIALGVILVLAPMAAVGFTTIYASVMFHEGSTLVVVLNALRILRHRPAGV